MTILDIITYPDARLRQHAEKINDFADPSIQGLVDDLLHTMAGLPACVGVAAPQTGHPYRLLVIHCQNGRRPPPEHHGLLVVGNPEIVSWSGMEIGREGCLSLPDHTGNVMRAQSVQVTFLDRHGQEHTLTLNGFEARVMQHEIDHLDGKLFTDRIVSRKADLFPRKQRT
ncbi:MAG: peptide deformylase [Magnetococcus sp. DMHC-8]